MTVQPQGSPSVRYYGFSEPLNEASLIAACGHGERAESTLHAPHMSPAPDLYSTWYKIRTNR